MLGQVTSAIFFPAVVGLAQSSPPLAPVVLLILCTLAALATVMLLPGKREAPWRKLGAVGLTATALILAALLVRWTAASATGGMGTYFWFFSTVALVGAIRVITHTKPVYSALYFVLTVFATAGLFVLLWAEFMAAALVLIYAGAILVTYVFVIMLAAEAAGPDAARVTLAEHDVISREPLAACAVGFALMGVLLFVIFDKSAGLLPRQAATADPVARPADGQPRLGGSTQELGAYLFRNHLINLELAGLLLTVAMVGAIIVARKRVLSTTPQLPAEAEQVTGPATPTDDNPHSIPVYGTTNPRQKEYPET